VSRRLAIPEALRERQARASNPRTSAWVSANAGSGKTHVLTQRVLRLLIDRTPPAQILCLAYTKAAAANMAERIFGQLAEWTSLDDGALAKAVVDCGAPAPGPQDLGFARQLFARTIETPGGLKIQTLHAFAERLLRLFPFEANVPAHFKVIDERESKLLLTEARDAALAALNAAPESAGALDLVAREAGALAFDDLLKEALSRSEAFSAYYGPADYVAALEQGERLRDHLDGLLGTDFDVLLTPSALGEAPTGLGATGDPQCNSIWTLAGTPCVTLPAGTHFTAAMMTPASSSPAAASARMPPSSTPDIRLSATPSRSMGSLGAANSSQR